MAQVEQISPLVQTAKGPLIDIVKFMKTHRTTLAGVKVSSGVTKAPLTVDMASDFGKISNAEVKKLTDNTLIAIGVFGEQLKQDLTSHSFDEMKALMYGSVILVHDTTQLPLKTAKVAMNTRHAEIPTASMTRWLKAIIDDAEIFEALDLAVQAEYLSKISYEQDAKTGKEYHIPLMDISVLRFPDYENEFFYLYKFTLHAFHSSNYDISQITKYHNTDVITTFSADFERIRFEPATSIIPRFSASEQARMKQLGLELFQIKRHN